MRARGMRYLTDDYDIVYDASDENTRRLIAALTHLDVFTFRGTEILTLSTNLGNIDLLSRVDGVGTFEDVLQRSTNMLIGDYRVPILSYDGLAATKRAAGRGKDLLVLTEIEALAEIERNAKTPDGDDA